MTRLLIIALLLASFGSPALAGDSLAQALAGGSPSLDLRLRTESSDQDSALRRATAYTLRTRLGLRSAPWYGLSALVEYEGTVALGDEDYNSGPGGNGNGEFSVIADPTGSELNRAWLQFDAPAGTTLRVGRQRIVLDDSRFVGNVGWRQNEQTFDAVSLRSQPVPSLTVVAAHVEEVHSIFFGAVDTRSQLLNLGWTWREGHKLTGYAYLLDFDGEGDRGTYGLRLGGAVPLDALKLLYVAEYASQRPHRDAPDDEALDFGRLEFGLGRAGVSAALGFERLDGDGSRGFTTPLATLHKFNGWADLFLATPAAGLDDLYARASYQSGAWSFTAVYHQFGAASGSADFGSEIDLSAGYRWPSRTAVLAKYADYSADEHGVDTRKFWLQLSHAL